jgi:hypothetical protein
MLDTLGMIQRVAHYVAQSPGLLTVVSGLAVMMVFMACVLFLHHNVKRS